MRPGPRRRPWRGPRSGRRRSAGSSSGSSSPARRRSFPLRPWGSLRFTVYKKYVSRSIKFSAGVADAYGSPCHRSACMASRPRGPGLSSDPVVNPVSSKSVFAALFVACAITGICTRAEAGDAGAAPMSMHGDLMTAAETETPTVEGALGTGKGKDPKVIYLRYADGTEQHTSNYDACNTGK